MNRPIKYASPAAREIRLARKHYKNIRRQLLVRFVSEIDDAIAAMIQRPLSFPEYLHGTRRVLLQKFPFMVVFQDMDEHFFIVAIAHVNRKPGYWKRRLVK